MTSRIKQDGHTADEAPRSWNLDDFKVGKMLGSGQYGFVYRAKEKESNFRVAIKLMFKSSIKELNVLHQVRREVEIHSHLNHPHILQLYGYFNDQNALYLVMEYAPYGTLYQQLQDKGTFSVEQSAIYIKQLAAAFHYLHERRIIHRDVKPENILIDANGNLKVADFGWCVFSERNRRQTLCGTRDYLSPEMIRGHDYGFKVDIWALGCMLYEFLLGYPPFDPALEHEGLINPADKAIQKHEFLKHYGPDVEDDYDGVGDGTHHSYQSNDDHDDDAHSHRRSTRSAAQLPTHEQTPSKLSNHKPPSRSTPSPSSVSGIGSPKSTNDTHATPIKSPARRLIRSNYRTTPQSIQKSSHDASRLPSPPASPLPNMIPNLFPTQPQYILYRISRGDVVYPPEMDPLAKDLIQKMLTVDPEERITPLEILKHPFVNKYAADTSLSATPRRTTKAKTPRQQQKDAQLGTLAGKKRKLPSFSQGNDDDDDRDITQTSPSSQDVNTKIASTSPQTNVSTASYVSDGYEVFTDSFFQSRGGVERKTKHHHPSVQGVDAARVGQVQHISKRPRTSVYETDTSITTQPAADQITLLSHTEPTARNVHHHRLGAAPIITSTPFTQHTATRISRPQSPKMLGTPSRGPKTYTVVSVRSVKKSADLNKHPAQNPSIHIPFELPQSQSQAEGVSRASPGSVSKVQSTRRRQSRKTATGFHEILSADQNTSASLPTPSLTDVIMAFSSTEETTSVQSLPTPKASYQQEVPEVVRFQPTHRPRQQMKQSSTQDETFQKPQTRSRQPGSKSSSTRLQMSTQIDSETHPTRSNSTASGFPQEAQGVSAKTSPKAVRRRLRMTRGA